MKYHAGILDLRPRRTDIRELTILALTPGFTHIWVAKAGRLSNVSRCFLARGIAEFNEPELLNENVLSITEEDAWLMLKATPTNYHGTVPLYATLWLQATPRTDASVAKELGVPRRTVMRWRNHTYFDPLTGVPTR